MQRLGIQRLFFYIIVAFLSLMGLYNLLFACDDSKSHGKMVPKESVQYMHGNNEAASYPYDKTMPLFFIGGVPRSGTTLMRAMLDAHPEVRCGEETRVVPRLLGMRGQWAKSEKESQRLLEAGLTDEVIDSALSAFILEVIAKHGEPAPRLCNKDPFTLKSSVYLAHLFPNSKFILMIRDGRAVVHSIITRKVTISGFDLKSYKNCLSKWNQAMESMYFQCLKVGVHRCMPVYYEQLVLHPERWMRNILEFLDIPWHDSVLHHEQLINKPGGVSLSKTERSTDQVIKPVNLEALSKWVPHFPMDIRSDMRGIAPMLEKLGYDPFAYPPNYGDPDKFVAENTVYVEQNKKYWDQRKQEVYSTYKGGAKGSPGRDSGNASKLGSNRNVRKAAGDVKDMSKRSSGHVGDLDNKRDLPEAVEEEEELVVDKLYVEQDKPPLQRDEVKPQRLVVGDSEVTNKGGVMPPRRRVVEAVDYNRRGLVAYPPYRDQQQQRVRRNLHLYNDDDS